MKDAIAWQRWWVATLFHFMGARLFWQMTYDENDKLITFSTNVFNVNVVRQAAISIAELFERYEPKYFLVVLEDAEISFSMDDVAALPSHFEEMALERRRLKTAILVHSTAGMHGLLMLKMVYLNNGIPLEIFSERQAAMEWLFFGGEPK